MAISFTTVRCITALALTAVLSTLIVGTAPEGVPVASAAEVTQVVPTATATSAATSGFDAGFIISDGVFFNSAAMSESAIQSWIASKSSSCVDYTSAGTKYTCLKNYKADSTTRLADHNCSAISGRSSELASSVIYRVSRACGINPQVLLVTLQKEQGFITGGARSSSIYRKAMGYGCPDTADCNARYYGLFNQVYGAAWQMQQYGVSNNFAFKAGRTSAVQYHPSTSCGRKTVTVRNKATAALYNYTPYTPNSAALAAGTGLGDKCSSYGNRNFFNYFKSWFGTPGNLLKNPGFEHTTGTYGWTKGTTGGITFVASAAAGYAHTGRKFVRLNATKPGGLMKQTLTYSTKVDGIYTGGVWVRASVEGTTVNGNLNLWAVGGTTEKAVVPFSVGTEWTYVSTDLTVAKSGHTQIRLFVDLQTTNVSLLIDDAEFSMSGKVIPPQKPMTKNGLLNPGFENSTGTDFWVAGDGELDYSAYSSSAYAHGGTKYLRAMAGAEGDRIKQTVLHTTEVGENYLGTLWVAAPAGDITGSLMVMAGGGTLETATTQFTASAAWTKISVTLPITKTGHTDLRFVVELDTPGLWLRADDASLLLGAAPVDDGEPTPGDGTPLTVANPGFESGTSPWSPGTEGAVKFSAYTSATYAHTGTKYLRVEAEAPGRRVKQTILQATTIGETYTNGIWLKAAHEGETVTGSLSLWAAGGGTIESIATPFTVGTDWTYVTNTLAIAKPGHTELRFVVQVDTVGAYLRLDDADLARN